MHAYHRDGTRVRDESSAGIALGITDAKWNGLPASVHLRLRYAIRVTHHNVCRLAVHHLRGGGVLIAVRSAGLRIKLEARASRRMAETVIQGHDGKQEQSADLNDVDAYVHGSGSVNSPVRDIGNGK